MSVIPSKKPGHPTCPPAPFFEKDDLMTYTSYRLTKYYTEFYCPEKVENNQQKAVGIEHYMDLLNSEE